jgi:CRISPR/Cas system-associated endonuclease Cas1
LYWQTLAALPLTFHASWRNAVRARWHRAGARTSPPSRFKSSRKAATPFHALINYGYAILDTETTIALDAHGCDPGMGILHTDKRYRGSLAHDLMEPVRPVVDGLIKDLAAGYQLARGEVFEIRGVCRLGPPLARRLARWAPALRPLLEKQARVLTGLLDADQTGRPARKRSAVIGGKGSKRRSAARPAVA